MELEFKRIGDADVFIAPEELVAKLKLQQGDRLRVIETPNGFTMSHGKPGRDDVLRMADEIIERDHEILAELAK